MSICNNACVDVFRSTSTLTVKTGMPALLRVVAMVAPGPEAIGFRPTAQTPCWTNAIPR